MGIQSSINSLLSQAQRLATFYKGFDKAEKIIGDTTATKNEAQIQTDIAAGNAPMKDGKVDPEWLQKRRDEFYNEMRRMEDKSEILFYPNGKLSAVGKARARILEDKIKGGGEIKLGDIGFYTDTRVKDYLKSFASNSELKNNVAEKLARASVEARTDSINKTKSNFNEHTASLIKEYAKGSGNP